MAWNPSENHKMALPPCHMMFQFFVANGHLDTLVYQRSCDMFLGVPYNITSYSLLTAIVANIVGLEPGNLIWTGGDCHIYKNHMEQVERYLAEPMHEPPQLRFNRRLTSIDTVKLEDFELMNYSSGPFIKAPISV